MGYEKSTNPTYFSTRLKLRNVNVMHHQATVVIIIVKSSANKTEQKSINFFLHI